METILKEEYVTTVIDKKTVSHKIMTMKLEIAAVVLNVVMPHRLDISGKRKRNCGIH